MASAAEDERMSMTLLILAVIFLAYSNGANDNFKGVATLYGSGAASYRPALAWATAATLLGAMLSLALASGLATSFSGQGLLTADVIDSSFLLAVAGAAATTIFLATIVGMPTSTTHALVGALAGAALMAAPDSIHWNLLFRSFIGPLMLGPFLAIGLTAVAYLVLHRARRWLGIGRQTCLCIGRQPPQPVALTGDGTAVLVEAPSRPVVRIGTMDRCIERYEGRFVGISAQQAVDAVHYASAGAVCFARAVNDTPKIAALLLAAGAAGAASPSLPLVLVTAAVVAGGLLQSRRVARTMSVRITELHGGQGLTGNLVTAALVLGASGLGAPLSTTHVSCGSIFGIGLVNGRRNWKTIAQIMAAWITTLPAAAGLGAALYWVIRS
jgi:inorganic phosphate transporter, PiT family